MSATSSSSDKYLFLFTTDSDDLSGVKSALQDFYKYPAGTDNTFEASGCSNFKSAFMMLIEKLAGTDPTTPVYSTPDPAGLVPAGETNMNTLVIVISGDADSSGLKDSLNNKLTWAELRQTIFGTISQPVGPPKTYMYQLYTEIHVVFASPYCNSFLQECDTNGIPVNTGTILIPQTTSNAIDKAGRVAFLNSWATELGLGTTTIIDSNGRISLNDIAASIHGGSVATYFRSVGAGVSGKYFPGYSYFEIYDGSPNWDESPDIYINAFSKNLYCPGQTSTVYINIHTSGTHPIKSFWIGAKHFGPGLGETDAIIISNLKTSDSSLPGIIKPGDSFLYNYNLMFNNTATYSYVVARAKFDIILAADIDDATDWEVATSPDEAQLNTCTTTITLTSAVGTDAQMVCINTAIVPITYATTGATGATITNLPIGVIGVWAANVVTINGTPTIAGSPIIYTVTLTGGCPGVHVTGTITINAKPAVVITNPAPVCSPATVDLTAGSVTTGSTAGLIYTYWTDAPGTLALSNPDAVAASGTYYIRGTVPVTGCNDIQPVTVTVNPVAVFSVQAALTHVICFGINTGAIVLTISGGSGSYTFLWSNGATTQNISNLKAGHYSVTVKDSISGAIVNSTFQIINIYIDIFHTHLQGIRIIFKKAIILPILYQPRNYMVRWRGHIHYPPFPFHQYPNVVFKNIVVTSSQEEVVSGISYAIAYLKCPVNLDGEISLLPPSDGKPKIDPPVETPVTIFLIRRRWMPFFPKNFKVADFKILFTGNDFNFTF